jgi:two-component system, NarL family, response regulator DevR
MGLIRVLLADDHSVVRYGVRKMIEGVDDIEVVGEAGSAESAIAEVARVKPDIVILDLELGDDPWLDTIAAIHQAHRPARILVYTAHMEPDCIREVVGSDIQGYLPKSASPTELLRAIRIIATGGECLARAATEGLAKSLRGTADAEQAPALETLTSREAAVLRLMIKGESNHRIAKTLHITERTVKFHVSAILAKLQVRNRTGAVLVAMNLPGFDVQRAS